MQGTSRVVAGICLLLLAATAHARELRSIRWYIVDLPSEFATPLERLLSFDRLLGKMMGPDHYSTSWENVDCWFYHQFMLSPRRVRDPARADVVVVPFAPRHTHFNSTFRSFMNQAHSVLPLLGKVPHLLVLHQPAFMWVPECVPPLRAQARARAGLLNRCRLA